MTDKFAEEQDAGRRSCERGRPEDFAEEVGAGRVDKMRARLEEDQAAGRRVMERTAG